MTDEQRRKIEEFKDKYLGIRPFGGIPEMNHHFEERGLDTGIAFGIKLENERLSAETYEVEKDYAEFGKKISDLMIENEKLKSAIGECYAVLKEANQICRSAYSIASRDGENTHWEGFLKRAKASLDIQFGLLVKIGIDHLDR